MGDVAFEAWLLKARENYQNIIFFEDVSEKEKNFLKMQKEIAELKPKDSGLVFQYRIIHALLQFEVGKLFRLRAEMAEPCFLYAWDIVKDHSLHSDCAYLSICILAELSALSLMQKKLNVSIEYSMQNNRLCGMLDFAKTPCIKSFGDLFLSANGRREKKEPASFLDEFSDIVKITGKAYSPYIEDQWLEIEREIFGKKHVTFKWLDRLKSFFGTLIFGENFRITRRLLSCATQINLDCEDALKIIFSDETDGIWEELKNAKIQIFELWGLYVVDLLNSSVKKVLREKTQARSSTVVVEIWSDVFNNLGSLSKEGVEKHESRIAYTLVAGYEEAKDVFLFGIMILKSLADYYDSDKENIKKHIDVTTNLCKLYQGLNFFVDDKGTKCEIHKRCIDLLEAELKISDVQNYPEPQRDMIYYLGDFYYLMVCIKSRDVDLLSPKRQKEINVLADKAAENYKLFLSFFTTEKLPNTIDNDVAERVLETHRKLANTYLMKYGDDAKSKIDDLEKAKELHTYLIKYIERNADHQRFICHGLTVLHQAVEKIPSRIQALLKEI